MYCCRSVTSVTSSTYIPISKLFHGLWPPSHSCVTYVNQFQCLSRCMLNFFVLRIFNRLNGISGLSTTSLVFELQLWHRPLSIVNAVGRSSCCQDFLPVCQLFNGFPYKITCRPILWVSAKQKSQIYPYPGELPESWFHEWEISKTCKIA